MCTKQSTHGSHASNCGIDEKHEDKKKHTQIPKIDCNILIQNNVRYSRSMHVPLCSCVCVCLLWCVYEVDFDRHNHNLLLHGSWCSSASEMINGKLCSAGYKWQNDRLAIILWGSVSINNNIFQNVTSMPKIWMIVEEKQEKQKNHSSPSFYVSLFISFLSFRLLWQAAIHLFIIHHHIIYKFNRFLTMPSFYRKHIRWNGFLIYFFMIRVLLVDGLWYTLQLLEGTFRIEM